MVTCESRSATPSDLIPLRPHHFLHLTRRIAGRAGRCLQVQRHVRFLQPLSMQGRPPPTGPCVLAGLVDMSAK